MTMLLADWGHTQLLEDIAQAHARPDTVAHSSAAPIESNGLLRHVLLLTTVACADE